IRIPQVQGYGARFQFDFSCIFLYNYSMNEMVAVIVQGVVVDPVTRGFAVILRDDVNSKWLPIYVGPFEAQSIALEMENTKLPRPGTHDLIKIILDNLNANVIKVNINDLKIKLNKAIEKENYEKAAKLRDEISKINPDSGRKPKTIE